jgi:hypothetical protein
VTGTGLFFARTLSGTPCERIDRLLGSQKTDARLREGVRSIFRQWRAFCSAERSRPKIDQTPVGTGDWSIFRPNVDRPPLAKLRPLSLSRNMDLSPSQQATSPRARGSGPFSGIHAAFVAHRRASSCIVGTPENRPDPSPCHSPLESCTAQFAVGYSRCPSFGKINLSLRLFLRYPIAIHE